MSYYLITYDLLSQNKDYKGFYAAIRRIGMEYFHPLETVWVVKMRNDGEKSSADISNNLRQYIDDKTDRLLVVQVSNQDIDGWLGKNFWQWIRNFKMT